MAVSLAVVLVASLFLGFMLGRSFAYRGLGIDPVEHRRLALALPAAQQKIREQARQLDVLATRHEVDRTALELVRKALANQEEEIAELDEGMRFYRSLMAPGEVGQGLSLRSIELVARDESHHFGFRIVAQQEARKHSTLRGEISVEILGLQGEQQVSYPLAELTDDIDGASIALQFRYFQAIEGELVLPEGFEPRSISVVAAASSPRKVEIREQYPWHIQERFTHVGK